jgi:hypothetical protein
MAARGRAAASVLHPRFVISGLVVVKGWGWVNGWRDGELV